MSISIVVISPVRNEGAFFESTLRSMVAQEVLPRLWVIVDDGSSDNTFQLASDYAARHDWIRVVRKADRGQRKVGPGVVEAFYYGLEHVDVPYDYLCKMDGDISFGPQYLKHLLAKFHADPRLGAASGKPFIRVSGRLVAEKTNDQMVAGQINFYRRQCFEQIGGFVREVHWDGIAFHRARMEGWRTASFHDEELKFMHLRLMGSSGAGIVSGRLRWGRGQYFLGTHPLYVLAIAAYRSFERPFVLGGLLILLGYCRSALRREARYEFPGFRRSLHAWQLARLGVGQPREQV